VFALGVWLLATVVAESHHHDALGSTSPSCAACAVAHLPGSVSVSVTVAATPDHIALVEPLRVARPGFEKSAPLRGRAPPAVLHAVVA
jgi:hypothetical protein